METLIVFKSWAYLLSENKMATYCKTDRRKSDWRESLLEVANRYHKISDLVDMSNEPNKFKALKNASK